MNKYTSNKALYRAIGIILFFVVWYVISKIIGQGNLIISGPIETIKCLLELLKGKYIYNCLFISLSNMLIGFLLSFVIAFILGVISGNSEKFKEILYPLMTALKSIPTASLVYLFLMIAGLIKAPIFIVMLVCMPIIYEATTSGIENVQREYIEAYRIDGYSEIKGNLVVKIPLAMPYILTGIASSFALSFKIEIMAEVITGSSKLGLGSAIASSQRSDPTNMAPIFAYSLLAIIVMFVIDSLINNLKKYLG